jgi:deazaflavin-dependent oxidoreductase (nitroreductase family)
MSTANKSRPSIVWRVMRKLNRRIAARAIGRGHGPRGVVLLLTTVGRKSGQPCVTPLQYEEDHGVIYVAAARGPQADWFRNAQANPHVKVQIQDRQFNGLAEPIVAAARIADFLELRLKRRRLMMRLLLMTEGLPPWADRAALERCAARKAMLAIRPLAKEQNES